MFLADPTFVYVLVTTYTLADDIGVNPSTLCTFTTSLYIIVAAFMIAFAFTSISFLFPVVWERSRHEVWR